MRRSLNKMALRTEIDVIKGGFNNWSPHGQDDEEDEKYEADENDQKKPRPNAANGRRRTFVNLKH